MTQHTGRAGLGPRGLHWQRRPFTTPEPVGLLGALGASRAQGVSGRSGGFGARRKDGRGAKNTTGAGATAAGARVVSALVPALDGLARATARTGRGARSAQAHPTRGAPAARASSAPRSQAAAAPPVPPADPTEQGAGWRAWAAADRALFDLVAARHWPGAERLLPRLSGSANHGRLWMAVAAGVALSGTPRARRCAARGLASLGVASATVNTLGKRSVRRRRPLLETVPLIRQLRRQPVTTSFPSGHAASAAAFVAGVALESPRWGAALTPLAAAVAFSRVYTGVHYPSDVLAGAALGVGAAFAVRGIVPTRSQLPSPGRPLAHAPAMRDGAGLVVVANASSGSRTEERAAAGLPAPHVPRSASGSEAREKPYEPPEREEPPQLAVVRAMLPRAEIITCDPASGQVGEALERAVLRAVEQGGALGVCGGDGTLNSAAGIAAREGVPLAVLPGGTHNHFAQDLGIEEAADTCKAVREGDAVSVDLGRFTPLPESPGEEPGEPGYFLNTFSLGSYPELVRVRERWAHRIGAWPAGVLAALQVLRTSGPVEAGLGGKERALWLLFAGNCGYNGGLAPVRRHDLADGQLDVRIVKAERWARTRLFVAALTSAVDRSPLHSSARLRQLMITGIPAGTHLAYDGEVAQAPTRLLLDKRHEALTVYRPAGR
jgi:diacylglycerol kinase family enzyme/membrane-associated phospholipid phosphatase